MKLTDNRQSTSKVCPGLSLSGFIGINQLKHVYSPWTGYQSITQVTPSSQTHLYSWLEKSNHDKVPNPQVLRQTRPGFGPSLSKY